MKFFKNHPFPFTLVLTYQKKRQGKNPVSFTYLLEMNYFSIAACAAATRAMGTRNGEQDT